MACSQLLLAGVQRCCTQLASALYAVQIWQCQVQGTEESAVPSAVDPAHYPLPRYSSKIHPKGALQFSWNAATQRLHLDKQPFLPSELEEFPMELSHLTYRLAVH